MITDNILEMLNDDIVSHGVLTQCVGQTSSAAPSQSLLRNILEELLRSGRIEIGRAELATPDYVEFIAWGGSVAERAKRAIDAVAASSDADREFAYWLCLSENVDRFE